MIFCCSLSHSHSWLTALSTAQPVGMWREEGGMWREGIRVKRGTYKTSYDNGRERQRDGERKANIHSL